MSTNNTIENANIVVVDCESYSYDDGALIQINDGVCSTSTTVTWSGLTTSMDELEELRELRKQKNKDKELRERNPILQEVYEEYLLLKKLCEDNKIDTNFEKRYSDFK